MSLTADVTNSLNDFQLPGYHKMCTVTSILVELQLLPQKVLHNCCFKMHEMFSAHKLLIILAA